MTTITTKVLRKSWRDWIGGEMDPTGPGWLPWLWTLLFALCLGMGFTVMGLAVNSSRNPAIWLDGSMWLRFFRVNFAISLTVSVLIRLLFAAIIPLVGKTRIRRFSPRGRAFFFIAIPLLGVIIGWPLGIWLVGQEFAQWIRLDRPGQLLGSAVMALGVSFLIFLFFNARVEQTLAEKRATEAQLRLLQGQMEPHFLFNTLANVQSLIEHDPAQARQLLESFTNYLRSSLGGLRRDRSTIGDELELARTYLDLIGVRMVERLRFDIDCPDTLRTTPVAPLLLQPLIENAIHHGLEPKIEGGTVRIAVRHERESLIVTVTDDGLGLDAPARRKPSHGAGVALANLRERLAAAFGADASLSLAPATPGTIATLRLPINLTSSTDAR